MTLALINCLLAQAGTAPNPTGETIRMIGTFAIMGVAMYLVFIRPQQKKAKEHQNMLTTLRAGDKVVLSGGIVGVVVSVKEKNVSIRSADSKLEVLKSAVTEITERGAETTESK